MPLPFFQEFPDKAPLIRNLQLKDRHFSRLFEEYHLLGEEIQASQPSDVQLEALRIRRLYIKDKLLSMLED